LTVVHTDGGRLNARPVARGEAAEIRTAAVAARTVDMIIAAWNRSDTIERAILSALAEPEVRHVIVVDDGSSDDTAARAGQCGAKDGRVIVQRLPSNLGPAAARNVALKINSAPIGRRAWTIGPCGRGLWRVRRWRW
jgi:cellulose synthase/poly-beta-1,6-N-acetylglucosamine synthase-like glycosyltransferase